jgi:hypothetical protein
MNRSINFTLYHRAKSLIPQLGRVLATDRSLAVIVV